MQAESVQGDPSKDRTDSPPPKCGEARALGYICKQTQAAASKILHSFANLSSLEHGEIPHLWPDTHIQV